jgi:hypothetical protein
MSLKIVRDQFESTYKADSVLDEDKEIIEDSEVCATNPLHHCGPYINIDSTGHSVRLEQHL